MAMNTFSSQHPELPLSVYSWKDKKSNLWTNENVISTFYAITFLSLLVLQTQAMRTAKKTMVEIGMIR